MVPRLHGQEAGRPLWGSGSFLGLQGIPSGKFGPRTTPGHGPLPTAPGQTQQEEGARASLDFISLVQARPAPWAWGFLLPEKNKRPMRHTLGSRTSLPSGYGSECAPSPGCQRRRRPKCRRFKRMDSTLAGATAKGLARNSQRATPVPVFELPAPARRMCRSHGCHDGRPEKPQAPSDRRPGHEAEGGLKRGRLSIEIVVHCVGLCRSPPHTHKRAVQRMARTGRATWTAGAAPTQRLRGAALDRGCAASRRARGGCVSVRSVLFSTHFAPPLAR